jgi:glycerol-3-phosphate acyltransferase PlsY
MSADILIGFGILLAAYLIGSIPFGLIVVWLLTGKDIRKVESGRTGATNAMRAAGFWAGLTIGILDILKSASAAWLARWLLPGMPWLHVFAPLLAILGHNYSIFMPERTPEGRLRLRGGAGGTPAVGGALGLWEPSFLILFPAGLLILFGLGYASLATMSLGGMVIVIFAIRAAMGLSPWAYAIYGVLAEITILVALRSNIHRLFNGTERLVGWRAKRQQEKD